MKPIDFIKIAMKDYKKVGAITLSSRHTIRRVLRGLKPGYKYIVEYGAGNGVVTKEILKHLPADGRVVAIELNERRPGAASEERLRPVDDAGKERREKECRGERENRRRALAHRATPSSRREGRGA